MICILLMTAAITASLCSVPARGQNALVANLKDGRPQTIVAYGTSLTAAGAWVNQLQGALDKKFPGRAMVINSGASGMWSKWGLDNLDKCVIEKRPDAVTIEFAINDAFLEYKTSPEAARRNLEAMIDRILEACPQCQVILMTMNPPTGAHLERRPKIEEYYAVYRQVAKQKKLLLIDHEPNWQKTLRQGKAAFDRYVPDGIHPNALGCEKVVLPQLLKSLGISSAK